MLKLESHLHRSLCVILYILLTMISASKRYVKHSWTSEDWIHPCLSSRSSCEIVCGIKSPIHRTCHHQTGLCLCPISAKVGINCRLPRLETEREVCNSLLCKKSFNHENIDAIEVRSDQITKDNNGNDTTIAVVCKTPDGNNHARLHCGCFIIPQDQISNVFRRS